MTPGLGMRIVSGLSGMECTNCAIDPRYEEKYDYVVEVAIVKCGPAVHIVRLCANCIVFACRLMREVRGKSECEDSDESSDGS